MNIRPFQPSDETAVVRLWQRCGLIRPWNNPQLDIERKLTVQPEWFLVGLLDDRLVASVMAGYDGHRGWINYLAVDPECQRMGLGRLLMKHVEQCLVKAGCPKVSLQIRLDNDDARFFYESLGFRQDPVISYGKRLIPDD